MVTSEKIHEDVLKESKYFLLFLIDPSSSKQQIHFLLSNPSKTHLKAIIEILFNLLENQHLKLSVPLKKFISQNKKLLSNLTSPQKSLLYRRKLLQTHYKIIYHLLVKAKSSINLAINQ